MHLSTQPEITVWRIYFQIQWDNLLLLRDNNLGQSIKYTITDYYPTNSWELQTAYMAPHSVKITGQSDS
jgi:hypothetical protein